MHRTGEKIDDPPPNGDVFGGMNVPDTHGMAAEEKESILAACLSDKVEAVDSAGGFFFGPHKSRHQGMLFGLGGSVGAHAAVLLSVLYGGAFLSAPVVPSSPFVTVSLVGMTEMEGDSKDSLEEGGKGNDRGALPASGLQAAPPTAQPGAENALSRVGAAENQPRTNDAGKEDEHPTPVKPHDENKRPVAKVSPQARRIPMAEKRSPKPPPTPGLGTGRQREAASETAAAASVSDAPGPRTPLPSPTPDGSTSRGGGSGSASETKMGVGSGEGPGGTRGEGSSAGTGGTRGDGTRGEFTVKEVDEPPSPLTRVEPEFPATARRLGAGGRVVVKFLVKADGSVTGASVMKAEPEGLFEQCALEAVRRWRFKPGRYGGEAVATWVVLPIQFRLAR